jgi:hypothetical protein
MPGDSIHQGLDLVLHPQSQLEIQLPGPWLCGDHISLICKPLSDMADPP